MFSLTVNQLKQFSLISHRRGDMHKVGKKFLLFFNRLFIQFLAHFTLFPHFIHSCKTTYKHTIKILYYKKLDILQCFFFSSNFVIKHFQNSAYELINILIKTLW